MINHKHKKTKIEHNDDILRKIQNRKMIEILSIIPTSLMLTIMWHRPSADTIYSPNVRLTHLLASFFKSIARCELTN